MTRLGQQPGKPLAVSDRFTEMLTDVWEELTRVLAPAGRFITRPVIIKGRQCNFFRIDFWRFAGKEERIVHGMMMSVLAQALIFVLILLPGWIRGCSEEDFLPLGGGANELSGKTVVVRHVPKPKKKIRYVVNPWSPIKIDVPDITEWTKEIDRQLEEGTRERYATGFTGTGTGSGNFGEGEGDEAGFGTGRSFGKVRFIRIKYNDTMWDNNMGKGADYNMLLEFNVRTKIKVNHETESRTIAELDNFKKYYSPPFVYLTGKRGVAGAFNDREIQMFRNYLLDKHGMIFADALGPGWGRDFKTFMRRVLPDVQPIYIPFDDDIHRRPYPVDRLPYVSQHDPPMLATGWKVKGRWVGYYHPGDVGDAWKDGHSGVSKDTAIASYELGCNVIGYAYRQYSLWVRQERGKQ